MNAPALSILIIARDAAPHLRRLLPALSPLRSAVRAELIVLIDDRTQDDTRAVAERWDACTPTGRFEGFGAFKEQGRRLCSGRWLLNLDADELPDLTLSRAILDAVRGPATFAGDAAVLTRIGDQTMRRGWMATSWRTRLFPRDLGHWDEAQRVHETPCLSVPRQRLPGVLHHASFADLEALRAKLRRYARLSADQRGGPPRPVRGAARGALAALRHLTLYGGALQGRDGLAVAAALGRATFERWTLTPGAH